MIKYLSLFFALFLIGCNNHNAQNNEAQAKVENGDPVEVPIKDGMARAYFASGCFWCVEAIYESVIGVDEVISGYSGGHTENPTYASSNTGKTGHAEAVEVIYDPSKINFATLVDVYFASQDPTQVNGQGPDRGSQYRSIIFYQNDEQKEIILEKKNALAKKLEEPVAAEVMSFQKFWKAEDYHQDFEKRNPQQRYIQAVSIPRFERFKRNMPSVVKEDH
ncbi:peptide-methionine (S)-S-oxide reductase MsrA [Gangjinia marincola]|uniref:Peptide methionine sulfoxide reductase MsrA n=1 Tax=Gangjinia marincola TaxID=578463 RepID=A0ABP3XX93_9FLAO